MQMLYYIIHANVIQRMYAPPPVESVTCRAGQNCIYAPYMTVYLEISLPKTLYIHRTFMALAEPTHLQLFSL